MNSLIGRSLPFLRCMNQLKAGGYLLCRNECSSPLNMSKIVRLFNSNKLTNAPTTRMAQAKEMSTRDKDDNDDYELDFDKHRSGRVNFNKFKSYKESSRNDDDDQLESRFDRRPFNVGKQYNNKYGSYDRRRVIDLDDDDNDNEDDESHAQKRFNRKPFSVSKQYNSKFSSYERRREMKSDHDDDDDFEDRFESRKPRFNSAKRYGENDFDRRRTNSFDRNNFKSKRFDKSGKTPKMYHLTDFESREGPIEIEEAKSADYHSAESQSSFDKYNLPESLLNQMKKHNYLQPFKIQEATLDHTLNGKDVFAKAFTGSGKTLAFAIPIIKKLTEIRQEREKSGKYTRERNPQCLVLSPTRELCLQLTESIAKLAPELKTASIYGGTGMRYQIDALERGVDIVCATPGRIKDFFKRDIFKTNDIKIICLDEADMLLKPEFVSEIHDIIDSVKEKQMLMFSATLSKEVQHTLYEFMKAPVMVDLTSKEKNPLPKNINHSVVRIKHKDLGDVVSHFLEKFESTKCIVFANRKLDTNRLERLLRLRNIRAAAISSDVSQTGRTRIIEKFKNGPIQVLVATDVAARGLDVPAVNLVLHYGASSNGLESYIHRSGRAGRAGKVGNSIVIDCLEEYEHHFADIKKAIKFKKIDYKPTDDSKSENHES